MSRIQIECDRCGKKVALPVRQNHDARKMLEDQGWICRDSSSRYGAKKEDYCPGCQ